MASRRPLRQSQFSSYLLMVSLPILLLSGLLLIQPRLAFQAITTLSQEELAAKGFPEALSFAFRMAGAGFLLSAITILSIRDRTKANRDLVFWQAVFLLFHATLLSMGPFYFQTNWWVLLPAIYFVGVAFFFLAYATRNLYVRE